MVPNHSKYGIGSGKAEEIKEFVTESNSDKIIVDEHLTSKQIHNLEKITGVPVIDRERLILDAEYSKGLRRNCTNVFGGISVRLGSYISSSVCKIYVFIKCNLCCKLSQLHTNPCLHFVN